LNTSNLRRGYVLGGALILISSCSSLPTPQLKTYPFPYGTAFYGDVKRPYTKLGLVRTQVDFPSLDPKHEEDALCKNYFNKAAADLVSRAKDQGGDAVIDLKSVVFYEMGRSETFPRPECSDDGEEGQVLAQGIAVKWKIPLKDLKKKQ
jgi:hypothetical protein